MRWRLSEIRTFEMDDIAAPRHRSPPFPFIGLHKALERAWEFYEKQRNHPAPVSVAVSLWGYAAKSSGGMQTLAALKHFGLLDDQGSGAERQVVLTDLALRILRDTRDPSPDRQQLIKEAALTPRMHRELWAKFGASLPAEGTVMYFLEVERGGFTNSSARDLIAEYVGTISFARLDESDKLQDEDGVASEDELPPEPTGRAPKPPDARKVIELGKVALMEGERVVFTEESAPQRYFKLVASGEPDEYLLEALADYVKRQRRRLGFSDTNAKGAA